MTPNETSPDQAVEAEPLPCPKCDGTNICPDQFAAPPKRNRYVIECSDCDYMTATYETVGEAIAAWNLRATTPPPQAGEKS